MFTYRGEDRRGLARTGRLTDQDVDTWVLGRFDDGWRWLTVERDGVEVARIGPHPDTGRRTWWSETCSQPTG